jgi:putative ABC transport system permease protein
MFSVFLSSFVMAFESLWANKVRATLTMLGIIIGVAAVITMTAIGTGAKKAVSDQITSMGTNVLTVFPGATFLGGASGGAGSLNKLTEDDAKAMRRSTLLTGVAPTATVTAQIVAGNLNWSTRVNGTTPIISKFVIGRSHRAISSRTPIFAMPEKSVFLVQPL